VVKKVATGLNGTKLCFVRSLQNFVRRNLTKTIAFLIPLFSLWTLRFAIHFIKIRRNWYAKITSKICNYYLGSCFAVTTFLATDSGSSWNSTTAGVSVWGGVH